MEVAFLRQWTALLYAMHQHVNVHNLSLLLICCICMHCVNSNVNAYSIIIFFYSHIVILSYILKDACSVLMINKHYNTYQNYKKKTSHYLNLA